MLVLHGLFIGSQTMWVILGVLLHIVILPENNKRIHKIFKEITLTHSVQFSSVQSLSRVLLCDPMNHSMPGFLVHHHSGVY